MDAAAGEAFDSMLHRDARFWGEIAARKVGLELRCEDELLADRLDVAAIPNNSDYLPCNLKGVSHKTVYRRCFTPYDGTARICRQPRLVSAALEGYTAAVPGNDHKRLRTTALVSSPPPYSGSK